LLFDEDNPIVRGSHLETKEILWEAGVSYFSNEGSIWVGTGSRYLDLYWLNRDILQNEIMHGNDLSGDYTTRKSPGIVNIMSVYWGEGYQWYRYSNGSRYKGLSFL